MKKVLRLAVTDFKIVFRDPSLRSFLVLPVILFVLVVWALPLLVAKYDFLRDYVTLFIIVAAIENTQVFSFITTMVLIDEKETNVAKVYAVVPLTGFEYLLSRFIFPFLFTVFLNIVLFSVQPFFEISWMVNLYLSLLIALIVPVYVLSINSLVDNRLQGMVYIKAANLIVLLPMAAFFLQSKFNFLFGLFPTHWIFRTINQALVSHEYIGNSIVAWIFFLVLLGGTAYTFRIKHFV